MGFDEICGQNQIIQTIRSSLRSGTTSHAYLFYGPEGIGKKKIATALVRALNCSHIADDFCGQCISCKKIYQGSHPDIHWIVPDGKSVKIDQIRQLKKKVSLKPHEARYQVFILDVTGMITPEAANSLLKVLEEPPPATVFILLCENPGSLPPTIVSRCQLFPLQRLDRESMSKLLDMLPGADPSSKERMLTLAEGIPGRALSMADMSPWLELYQEAADVLSALSVGDGASMLASQLAGKENLTAIIDTLLALLRDLLVMQSTGEPELILYQEHMDIINTFTEKWSEDATIKVIEEIITLQKMVRSPVNVRLALELTLRRIKEVFENANSHRYPL
ncbi:MAG: DNA polymerase III subunit delta' [Clostridiales bacterium]|jgi:DNA polymerase-3 subunit delta'|nr:DNA polymerase III subunit delta' [Clostridiales bacterium]